MNQSRELKLLTIKYIKLNNEIERLNNKKDRIIDTIIEKNRVRKCVEHRLKQLHIEHIEPPPASTLPMPTFQHVSRSARTEGTEETERTSDVSNLEAMRNILETFIGDDTSNMSGTIERTVAHF